MGTGCGEVDQECAERASRHAPIDVCCAIVRVEALNGEGERSQQLFQGRESDTRH
jgi:hypothetical protein